MNAYQKTLLAGHTIYAVMTESVCAAVFDQMSLKDIWDTQINTHRECPTIRFVNIVLLFIHNWNEFQECNNRPRQPFHNPPPSPCDRNFAWCIVPWTAIFRLTVGLSSRTVYPEQLARYYIYLIQ